MTTINELDIRLKAVEATLRTAGFPWENRTPFPGAPSPMLIGVNVNAQQVEADEAIDSGCSVVRFPLWADALKRRSDSLSMYRHYAAALLSKNVEPFYVMGRRSWLNEDFPLWASLPGRFFQMESAGRDPTGGSLYAQKVAFNAELRWAREWLDNWRPDCEPKRFLVAGEFGNRPELLDDFDLSPCDAVGVYLFGQRAGGFPRARWGVGDLRESLQKYKAHSQGKLIVVSEFGTKPSEFNGPAERAEHMQKSLQIMSEEGVYAAFWYCLSPEMHGDYALQGPSASTTEQYEVFKALALRQRRVG